MQLKDLGWDPFFQYQFGQFESRDLTPARIMGVHKNSYTVNSGNGHEFNACLAGRLRYFADGKSGLPAAGDWVVMEDKRIAGILPRKNALSRGSSGNRGKKAPAPTEEQVIAANLDTVFIVCGLDRDFNLRRIERYLTLIYNCGISPVVILTKSDLHPKVIDFEFQVEQVAPGVPVHAVSAIFGQAMEPLQHYLGPGQTVTLIGSSGAGKSTLVNRLAGHDVQSTRHVSAKLGKGLHTTTSRALIPLPEGGILVDTPGLREISLWEGDEGIEAVFEDIANLARECRFSDCSHQHEPGCRVQAALDSGELSIGRFESYLKMEEELRYLAQRQTKSSDRIEKERWKKIALQIRRHPKLNR